MEKGEGGGKTIRDKEKNTINKTNDKQNTKIKKKRTFQKSINMS